MHEFVTNTFNTHANIGFIVCKNKQHVEARSLDLKAGLLFSQRIYKHFIILNKHFERILLVHILSVQCNA